MILGTLGADGAPRAVRDVHAVALHEIGHELGLAPLPRGRPAGAPGGGSVRSAAQRVTPSVMTADVAADEVTSADGAALRVWYALPLGALCDASTTP